jgi:hypothetical protein
MVLAGWARMFMSLKARLPYALNPNLVATTSVCAAVGLSTSGVVERGQVRYEKPSSILYKTPRLFIEYYSNPAKLTKKILKVGSSAI